MQGSDSITSVWARWHFYMYTGTRWALLSHPTLYIRDLRLSCISSPHWRKCAS